MYALKPPTTKICHHTSVNGDDNENRCPNTATAVKSALVERLAFIPIQNPVIEKPIGTAPRNIFASNGRFLKWTIGSGSRAAARKKGK